MVFIDGLSGVVNNFSNNKAALEKSVKNVPEQGKSSRKSRFI